MDKKLLEVLQATYQQLNLSHFFIHEAWGHIGYTKQQKQAILRDLEGASAVYEFLQRTSYQDDNTGKDISTFLYHVAQPYSDASNELVCLPFEAHYNIDGQLMVDDGVQIYGLNSFWTRKPIPYYDHPFDGKKRFMVEQLNLNTEDFIAFASQGSAEAGSVQVAYKDDTMLLGFSHSGGTMKAMFLGLVAYASQKLPLEKVVVGSPDCKSIGFIDMMGYLA